MVLEITKGETMEKKFYRPNEVAVMLGVHRNTIIRWVKSGKLKSSVIGESILIPASEIERLEKGD